jgi:hypothetical protein
MSRQHLDDHLRRYYGSQEIDPLVLGRLKRLADLQKPGAGSICPDGRSATRRRLRSRVAVASAAVAAALVLLFFASPGFRGAGTEGSQALADSILREIALNHSKNLMVEYAAIEYPRLREQMGELDFPLRAPRQITRGKLRMLGGRYCSIRGRLAAQIKLEDEHGRVLTLYQTSFDEHFDGLPELQREQDGIQIRVWREDDLLFALAGSEI